MTGKSPAFAAPWQARVYALADALVDNGIVTPAERAEALGAAIARAQAAGDPDRGDTYYAHLLDALEALVREKVR